VVKDDPIFDKYLQKVDDELEPRKQRNDFIDLFVNLGATQEDHGETGNQKDVTMQAGRQRGALPLMRKFNEHSERLLNAAMGDGPPAKRRKTNSDYTQIELDDLYDSANSVGILLDMKDSQRYFESRSKKVEEENGQHRQDTMSFICDTRIHLANWSSNLTKLNIEREHGNAALASMTQNVAPRLDIKSRRSDIPEPLLRQMRTCQTAANEFLRQFWAALYPPRSDVQTASAGAANSAQRAAKAAKMVGYLVKTPEKVEALVQRARMDGIDHERVRTAMKPVLNAAERAVVFHQTKRLRAT
jgi:transcription initiation factor TFIIH subunit 1